MIKREIGVLMELMEKSEGDRDARERQQQEEMVKKRMDLLVVGSGSGGGEDAEDNDDATSIRLSSRVSWIQ